MGGVGRRTTPYSGSSVKFIGLVEADAVTFLAQQGGEGAVMSVFVCPTCHSNPPTPVVQAPENTRPRHGGRTPGGYEWQVGWSAWPTKGPVLSSLLRMERRAVSVPLLSISTCFVCVAKVITGSPSVGSSCRRHLRVVVAV